MRNLLKPNPKEDKKNPIPTQWKILSRNLRKCNLIWPNELNFYQHKLKTRDLLPDHINEENISPLLNLINLLNLKLVHVSNVVKLDTLQKIVCPRETSSKT